MAQLQCHNKSEIVHGGIVVVGRHWRAGLARWACGLLGRKTYDVRLARVSSHATHLALSPHLALYYPTV